MPYVHCSTIGSGTITDPFRPAVVADLPTDGSISWAATDLGDGTFLVSLSSDVPAVDIDPKMTTLTDSDALALIQQHNPSADDASLSN